MQIDYRARRDRAARCIVVSGRAPRPRVDFGVAALRLQQRALCRREVGSGERLRVPRQGFAGPMEIVKQHVSKHRIDDAISSVSGLGFKQREGFCGLAS